MLRAKHTKPVSKPYAFGAWTSSRSLRPPLHGLTKVTACVSSRALRARAPARTSCFRIASQLMPTDRIGEKLQLRLSVCDKGGYGIKVGEFEF
jgi:hypothetical protein